MAHLDISKFATAIKCRRVPNAHIKQEADGTFSTSRSRWTEQHVLFRTEDHTFVLPRPLKDGMPSDVLTLVGSSRAFALVPTFEASLERGPALGRVRLEPFSEPLFLTHLDRAINVCQDLGRWDMAVHLILDLLGRPSFHPESIQWAGFPHTSRMAFVIPSAGRAYIPGGAAKSVLETWWAASGGYHATQIWLPARSEYETFMASVRNPWSVIGVDAERSVRRDLQLDLLPVQHPRPPVSSSDPLNVAVRGNVAYRADENGTVRPFYPAVGTEGVVDDGGERAWGPAFRDAAIRHMRLPLFIAREVGT